MKSIAPAIIVALSISLIAGVTVHAAAAERMKPAIGSEVEQVKSALVGKVMGGREKCWKFESVSQIKELVIRNRKELAQKRLYSVALTLQDARVPGLYKAEAEITYEKVDSEWQINVVGLKSLRKVE